MQVHTGEEGEVGLLRFEFVEVVLRLAAMRFLKRGGSQSRPSIAEALTVLCKVGLCANLKMMQQ